MNTKGLNLTAKTCLLLFLTACSAAMVMNKRLPSEWSISNYEERMADGSASSVANIGSIKFEANGTGTKSVNFKLVDKIIEDYQPFEWKVIADTVIISGASFLSKAWTVMENSPSSQTWKHTDKGGNSQTMTLVKNRPETRISQRAND